ncbi:energy transducer TonB [Echinimonas agarilytica]|uniref:Protein TonB n=1 Tax=Echinimonas agarilytica TaxID=1215918 RepID=A0AA42B8H5_9GAMM|nr:energy transducer TonB [Echinimonas agarilytica]MCM2680231.1 energy transducer TonB [Echinimonas agarilytica]
MVIKYLSSLVAAIIFGVAVFIGMQLLIANDGLFKKPDRNNTYLNFVRVDAAKDDVNTKDRRLPDPPPPPETPPDAPDMSQQFANVNANLNMNMPKIGVPMNKGSGPFLGTLQAGNGMAGFDTDVIPVVRVPPSYPRGAKAAKLEGYVTMAVTIRPDGSVADVEVLEENPPRLFTKSAISAMKRWKFRPKIVNGKPTSQRARQTIEFKLGK